ncbi:MAG: ornithine carbamoyltransferase [Acidimicrobiia bacterium]|nr:ornithine carbamoyltransferase [bacterium]MXZ69545.1 ornithine carbamoyltransferase [Acidimicrobiia bacterium]MYB45856.1 ornithine carbamoyltransferase [Acidimicrobiia bacterium]MYC84163.1 ornithine carbamoyltransferase [Acidimicrobiia bacterium]
MNDFLGIADLDRGVLERLVESASRLRHDRSFRSGALAGSRIGLFFEKPSTRTRVSSEVAAVDLGAHPVVLGQSEVGIGSREAVRDVARVLDRYLDLVAMRVFDHRTLVEMAEHADAPVVNLLSDVEHPCQAVADLQTIAEHRQVAESVVAYVGDGNNVCHSLMLGVARLGGRMRVVSPPGFEPREELVARGEGRIMVTPDVEAVDGADVVYTDVWASMGQEAEASERALAFAGYRVDEDLFARARPDAIFLHCLPAHRGEEVTDAVVDHPRSRVFDQAENRLHSMKAILLELLE